GIRWREGTRRNPSHSFIFPSSKGSHVLHSDFPNGTNCGYVQAAHRSKRSAVHSKHGGKHAFYSLLLLLLKTDPHFGLRPPFFSTSLSIFWVDDVLISTYPYHMGISTEMVLTDATSSLKLRTPTMARID